MTREQEQGHGVSVQDGTLQITSAGDDAAWDALAARDAEGTFCHLLAWRGIMEDVLGHQTYYLVARAPNDAVVGTLPLVRVRSRLFGDYLISVPFLNYGGPLGTMEARSALCSDALRLAKSLNVDLLEVRARGQQPPALNLTARKLAVIVPLPESAEELWEQQFRSKLRNKIKRPINQGMQCRIGPDQIDPFYDIFARNMRDLGTPVLPRAWFDAIRTRLSAVVVFAAVYDGPTPVAAGCGFVWNGEFELSWSSALREYNSRHPNMLLCWSLMEEAIRRSARSFNFGRSTPGSSTHHFKQQWGGEDVPLPWGTWGRRDGPPNPNSTKFRLARTMWSHLPLSVSRRLGPTISPYIP